MSTEKTKIVVQISSSLSLSLIVYHETIMNDTKDSLLELILSISIFENKITSSDHFSTKTFSIQWLTKEMNTFIVYFRSISQVFSSTISFISSKQHIGQKSLQFSFDQRHKTLKTTKKNRSTMNIFYSNSNEIFGKLIENVNLQIFYSAHHEQINCLINSIQLMIMSSTTFLSIQNIETKLNRIFFFHFIRIVLFVNETSFVSHSVI